MRYYKKPIAAATRFMRRVARKAPPITVAPHVFPGIRGGDWTVTEGRARTNLLDHTMCIGGDESLHSEENRLEELGHARWSPPLEAVSIPTMQYGRTLQVVEDARIWKRLMQSGMWDAEKRNTPTISVLSVSRAAPSDEPLEAHAIRGAVAFFGRTANAKVVDDLCKQIIADLTKDDVARNTKLALSFEAAITRAKGLLRDYLTINFTSTEPIANAIQQMIDAYIRAREQACAPPDPGEPTPDGDSSDRDPDEDVIRKIAAAENVPTAHWGEMRTVPFPMRATPRPAAQPPKHIRVLSDAGTRIRDIRRWYTDRQIFERRIPIRRPPDVTLLLDMSGSMGYNNERIEYFLQAIPRLTVYGYAAPDDKTGYIALFAEKDQIVDNINNARSYLGGGNLVDLPALQFLAKRKGARVWISDGQVCDIAGCNIRAKTDCRDFIIRSKIGWMTSLESAIEHFTRPSGKCVRGTCDHFENPLDLTRREE